MYDICALGELIVDCTPVGKTELGAGIFACNPGGAPGNVAVSMSKLGKRAAFIGKVGNDQFGKFFIELFRKNGIETRGILLDSDWNTTLAFVELDEKGERSFGFYRKMCADVMLEEKEVDRQLLGEAKLFHFGSVSLTQEPSRTATFRAAEYMKENNRIVSYDPNYRENLWSSRQDALEIMRKGFLYADVVKVSDEELFLFTGIGDVERAGRVLYERYPMRCLLITLGEKGACCIFKDSFFTVPGYRMEVADTNGAGDASMGGFLFKLTGFEIDIEDLSTEEVYECLRFANAAGALATTKSGAIPAMPLREEVEALLKREEIGKNV